MPKKHENMKKNQSKNEFYRVKRHQATPNGDATDCATKGDDDISKWLTNIKQKAKIRRGGPKNITELLGIEVESAKTE
jgi:hypothetical protein